MNCVLKFAVLILAISTSGFRVGAQLSAKDSLAEMRVADGLEVTLFAAEPDLRNPTMMDIDAQGRVWVTEAANYRLFNQDIADEAGDRIRVLEDTDGDGVCDKAWTYYQDKSLQAPMGIAVLGDRVYVCQSPELFYLRDIDGDGRADERTVVLTGFGGIDNDHAIHGVMFGPDGLLYMSNGDQGLDVTDKLGNRIHAGKDAPIRAATVLRTDLEGNRLELVASNMRNPYEPTADAFGNVFISDNDDDGNEQTRINYVMEGGDYGYWPRRKGDRRLDAVHWNEDRPGTVPKMIRTGFGSPTGLTVYEGDLLPEKFHGALIHAEAGPGEIRAFWPSPDGAGFRAEMEVLLSCEGDKWFRPSDVTVAPDGSVFVADWYDPGVGGHRMADTTRGRVYRIAPKGSRYAAVPFEVRSSEGILAALGSPNQAMRFLGYEAAKERAERGDVGILKAELTRTLSEEFRARILWAMANDPASVKSIVDDLIVYGDTASQVLGVRIAAARDAALLKEYRADILKSETPVRRQALVEIARAAWRPWMLEFVVELARQCDGERFYVEAIGIAARGREREVFDAVLKSHGAKWDDTIAPLAWRLHPNDPRVYELAESGLVDDAAPAHLRILALNTLDALGSDQVGTDRAGARLIAVVGSDLPEALQSHALGLLARDEGDAWRGAVANGEFSKRLDVALANPKVEGAAWAFVEETHRVEYLPRLIASARNQESARDARVTALEAIRAMADRVPREERSARVAELSTLIDDAEETVRTAMLDAIGAFRHDDAVQVLRDVVANAAQPKPVRLHVARQLARDKSGSVLLVAMAQADELPVDVTLDVGEMLHASPWEDVRLMAEQALPRETSREGESLPPMEDLIARTGDAEKGRAVFFSPERSQCYTCHVINGEGRNVGPELSKIGEKLGKQAILESILNPSAAIAHEYKVWMVRSETRGYLSGYIRSESDSQLELMESTGNAARIPASDILEKWESNLSLMPEGLSTGMTVEELVDIVEYLASLR